MTNQEDDTELSKEDIDDSVVAEESAQESVKKLRERLKEAETKAKEYLDGWQRSQADFVNLRKRDEEAKVEFVKFANESLITELTSVLDSLDMAISHGSKDLEPVRKQFLSILEARGLKVSEPMGETFDPRFHEAVGAIKTEDKEEDHKILEIIQKGYILSGKIIRPAKVRIGQFTSPDAQVGVPTETSGLKEK